LSLTGDEEAGQVQSSLALQSDSFLKPSLQLLNYYVRAAIPARGKHCQKHGSLPLPLNASKQQSVSGITQVVFIMEKIIESLGLVASVEVMMKAQKI
jgi:hypothetical protein